MQIEPNMSAGKALGAFIGEIGTLMSSYMGEFWSLIALFVGVLFLLELFSERARLKWARLFRILRGDE